MFVVAGGDKRCQHFIDTVNGGAAINVAGNLSNNLLITAVTTLRSTSAVQSRRSPFKALGQHAFQVDQHAVEHREKR